MIILVIPSSRSALSVVLAAARGVSNSPMAPRSRVRERIAIVVRPRSRKTSIALVNSGPSGGTPSTPNISSLPIQTFSPPTIKAPSPLSLLRATLHAPDLPSDTGSYGKQSLKNRSLRLAHLLAIS